MAVSAFLVEGYRSLKSVRWNPGSLNVLIGPNGSGKSNLLRALALLQQAVMNQEFAKVVLQQGGVQNLLWDRKSPELRWRVLADSSGFHTRSEPNQHVLYELVITPVPWQQSGFKVSRELLSECYFVGNEWEYVNIIERDENRVSTFDD